MRTPGYSGKPLWQKLGLAPGKTLKPISPPEDYAAWIDGAGADIRPRARTADLVHLFCRTRADLEAGIACALASVAPGGMLWVSWPKKTSALFRDLTEDGLREVILPLGFVDVKVCAVSDDWSGLKFVRRTA
jgi:hypothetical protein